MVTPSDTHDAFVRAVSGGLGTDVQPGRLPGPGGGEDAFSRAFTTPEKEPTALTSGPYDNPSKFGAAVTGGDPTQVDEGSGTVEGPPATPGDYDFSGLDAANQDAVEWFRSAAHAAGLSQAKAAKLSQSYQTLMAQQVEAHTRAIEESTRSVTSELQRDWGGDFDNNSKLVQDYTTGMSDTQFTVLVNRLILEEAKRGGI